MDNVYCIIMAGGIGSRFWPLSRTSYPKQFIDILGTGESLIQQTYRRLRKVSPKENILVVTNDDYVSLVAEQLPEINPDQILGEPMRRNTAPCIAYATHKIKSKNKNNPVFVVAPADHLITNEDEFITTIESAVEQARSEECLVTLGIKPSRPDTGYGYIQFHNKIKGVNDSVMKVKTFTEKPDLHMAQTFVESGDFVWNSGIFIWSSETILKEFGNQLPEMDRLFQEGENAYYTEKEREYIQKIYPLCKNISVDFGIMENASNVYVVAADFGWSDLGTWGSLYTHSEKDEFNNALQAENVYVYDSDSNMLTSSYKEKLYVIQGLRDYIIVDVDDVLLICEKSQEQRIKQFVTDIKLRKQEDFV